MSICWETPSKKSVNGFTLIELLVVIAIIGVLASVVLASLNSARAAARDAVRISEVRQLQTALELYANNNNNLYPCYRTDANCRTAPPDIPLPRIIVNRAPANVPTNNFRNDMAPYITLKEIDPQFSVAPDYEGNQSGSIFYQNTSDRKGYTLLLRFEGKAWCRIDNGGGYFVSASINDC